MRELESLLEYAKAEGRVCPMPDRWIQLSALLGEDAPPPLILAAWSSSPSEKRQRVEWQLRCAADLGPADRFFRGLKADEWCYLAGRSPRAPAQLTLAW